MTRSIDPLLINNVVDANILDGVAEDQDAAIRNIVDLVRAGEIVALLPYSVRNEARDPNSPDHVRRAADLFGYSPEMPLTIVELKRYNALVATVQGNALPANIAPDLFHVCAAASCGGHFITRDKRLLARSLSIANILPIAVVSPEDFLKRVLLARNSGASKC